jgi:hypothetical protein
MKHLLVALVAVFALSAVAVASASAAAKPPEFKSATEVCVKVEVKETGRYTTSACTTESATHKGEFDLIPTKHKFTDKEGTSNFYATGTGGAIVFTCTADTSKGEITGAKTTAGVTVTFTGCTAKEGTKASCPANSVKEKVKEPAGTIKTNGLKDVLGTVAAAEATSEVGDALKPEGEEGFVTLEAPEAGCLAVKTTQVSGSVIGEVKPINVMQTTGELIFACKSGEPTVQKIQRFVGAEKDTLLGFGKAACFESKDEITYEEPIEVT